jgi:hypothetical protein
VLIDLKIGKLTHQDLGQMQMYVNYFDRFVKNDQENSTVGIVLCKKKDTALVEITLPTDANIHAREYQLYLPSKEELQQKLEEWIEELILRQIGPGVTIQHESLPGVNMISMMQLFLSLPVISLN